MRAAILVLSVGVLFSISNPSSAQTNPGDFTGQPTLETTIRNNYPICLIRNPNPLVSPTVTQGLCSDSQLSQGGMNLPSDKDPATNQTSIVKLSQFPGSGASQSIGIVATGTYYDPQFVNSANSVVTATLPLSDFATASSVSSMNAALGAETNRALAAETALGQGLVNEATAREADVARLSSQFRVATATAVALGGNGFIPGKRLNLTINYGSYEGKSAMAFQGGFIVNTNAYVNLGVASGLNGGGTAFRTGLTMGW